MVSFAAGMAFLLMGAWPVFGFLGLDVLVVYWAFKVNFRAARATEEITVTPLGIAGAPGQPIAAMSSNGRFNPLWVQLDQEVDAEFGIEQLYLVSRGRRRCSIAALPGRRGKGEFCQRLESKR